MRIHIASAIACAAAVAGCGGGSGSGNVCQPVTTGGYAHCAPSGNPPPPSTAIPEGIWGGATSDGAAVSLLVLETGQYYLVPTSPTIDGLVEGIMTASNYSFTDAAAVVYSSSTTLVAGTVSGSFIAKTSLSGTLTTAQALSSPFPQGATSVTFNGNYNSLYDTPATVAEAVGTWSGQTSVSTSPVTLTVAANGAVSGSDGICTFSGSVSPRPTGKHVLDGTVTFSGSGCLLQTSNPLTFETVIQGDQLVAAGVTSQRDHGFSIFAKKN